MLDAVRPARSDEDPGYDPSRRQLLVTLLALPVALSPALQLGGASSFLVRRLLTQCGASITAAWHLLKQSDLAIVEQHVSSYLLALAALARQPSAHQAEAARLASQAHRVLAIVALHRRQFRAVRHHHRQALQYAEIVGDASLQASVLLAASGTAVLHGDDPVGAAEYHQQLLQRERQLTPLQRARLHSQLAIGLAREGQEQESLQHLHLAEAEYPTSPEDDPGFARQDFGTSQGAVAERIRVEIVNHQAATALEMRDLESFVSHLSRGVQGARHLRSALRLHEAENTWRRALEVWPTEPRVTALAELFADSPGQLGAEPR